MMQTKGKNERFADNLWKVTSLILLIVIVVFIAVDRMEKNEGPVGIPTMQYDYPIGPTQEFNEVDVCKKIPGTPAWVDDQGNIIDTGYTTFGDQSINIVTTHLIPQKVHFVYSDTCGWCHKQIEYFGNTWDDYVEANLTHNCRTIFSGGQ